MADPVPVDHLPAILGLVGTLAGTAIGFAGGLVSQWLLEGKKQKAETKKKKAEKLEELVSLAHEHGRVFLQRKAKEKGLEVLAVDAKIAAITGVYFPHFTDYSDKATSLMVRYYMKLEENADSTDLDRIKTAYLEILSSFIVEMQQYARREFQ